MLCQMKKIDLILEKLFFPQKHEDCIGGVILYDETIKQNSRF